MNIFIKNIGRLYSGSAEILDAAVLVNDGVIAYAGPANTAPISENAEVIDAGGRLCMPALYNAHTHAGMTTLRGVGADLSLQDWLFNEIFPREDRFTPEAVRISATLSAAEMIRTGTVCMADMYFFSEQTARAAYETGIRALVAQSAGTQDCDTMQARMDSAKALFGEWDGVEGRIRIAVGPHAEYTMSKQTLTMAAETAQKLGAAIIIHSSETAFEHEQCIGRHGVTPTKLFSDLGLLNQARPCILAHGVHMTDDDFAILAETGTYLAHCPVSNLKLGAGAMRLPDALKIGVKAALGTDSCASNNTLDLFEEIKWTALLHKGLRLDPTLLPAPEAISLATRCGAAACGFADCGVVEAGAPADLLLLNTAEPHALPIRSAAAHIAYAARGGDVWLTMCAGKVLYRGGEYLTIDIEKLQSDVTTICESLNL